ncbi:MAG: hypothetical protein ACP5VS_04100 [Desulfomonilaceae bacterium]
MPAFIPIGHNIQTIDPKEQIIESTAETIAAYHAVFNSTQPHKKTAICKHKPVITDFEIKDSTISASSSLNLCRQ